MSVWDRLGKTKMERLRNMSMLIGMCQKPLIDPIDHEAMVRNIENDRKISRFF